MKLLEVQPGEQVKVTGFEGGKGLQTKLTQHGIYPGDCLRLLRKAPLGGPLLVEVNQRELALGRGIAARIIVEVMPCESL